MTIFKTGTLTLIALAGLLGTTSVAAAYDQVFIGNYPTLTSCEAEGANMDAHPGWVHFRCDARDSGSTRNYDLYLTT
ncbi:hypothetical protein ACFXHA_32855 [Nocardia sp. NPDC059240]|uniref:hypothetical protein n=1 Tax=Nocardia sp. NPDC059240 TaxID=3346786 RepID=UPI00369E3430